MMTDVDLVVGCLFILGFTATNFVIFALNLKLYTEIMKEKSQRGRRPLP